MAGPRRRLYDITPLGLDNLAEIAERLAAITRTHDTLFHAYAQTAAQLDVSASRRSKSSAPATPPGGIDLPALDHVALSVQNPGTVEAFLCDHLGMQELGRSADGVLLGADARATKLSLIAADGPTEPAALARLVLRVADLRRARPTPTDRAPQRSISGEDPAKAGRRGRRNAAGRRSGSRETSGEQKCGTSVSGSTARR